MKKLLIILVVSFMFAATSLAQEEEVSGFSQQDSLTAGQLARKYYDAINDIEQGVSYRRAGEYAKAKEKIEKGLPVVKAADFKFIEANAYQNLGFIYLALGDKKSGQKYFNKAGILYEQISAILAERERELKKALDMKSTTKLPTE